ncbi:MAG: aminopeptidase P N-terminal domain-containing protein, partial [Erysipelotrichaceae bacterium]|nr:aminopeptidase P N-terminal domain-containing protein [Erysipelotrichaceae bacterium]
MYQERRERLFKELPKNSVAIFMAGRAPYQVGDEKYPFDVNRTFYYLTGLDRENLVLLMAKGSKNTQTILFIEQYDPEMARWVGGKIQKEEAQEISGITDIRFVDELEGTINRYLGYMSADEPWTLCGELNKQYLDQPSAIADLFNKARAGYPDVSIKNISGTIARMRMIKNGEEVTRIKKALAVTNAGIKAMMQASREYIWENELEAYFDFVLKSEQCGHAFHTICAAGKNATTLHYGENNCQSEPGDLVLCDLGASFEYYNADITRTFPINGRFSVRQRELYEIVLKANKMIIERARPGVTLRELNNLVIEFYERELPKVGLLQGDDTVRDYYFHGVSHHLGLETHDVSIYDAPLQAGNVITDEPGLYLADEGIGIRIEDDLLSTEDGCVNL